MEDLQAKKALLEADLADADLFARDPGGFQTKIDQLARLQEKLDDAEERWLALEMEAEAEAS